MEGEQSILNGTKDSFHSALLLPLNDMIDNDEDFEAPCFCAQQLLGALFGAVFAYIASLLFASAFAISLSLSMGIVFGLLASETSNPFNIDTYEFLVLALALLCQSYSLLLAFGADDLSVVFLLIALLAAVAAPFRSLLRYRNLIISRASCTQSPGQSFTQNSEVYQCQPHNTNNDSV